MLMLASYNIDIKIITRTKGERIMELLALIVAGSEVGATLGTAVATVTGIATETAAAIGTITGAGVGAAIGIAEVVDVISFD